MSNEIACPSIMQIRPWSLNDAHEQLGHPGQDVTHEIVKGLNLNMQPGPMDTCWACTVAKAKQKNVMHFSLHEKSQVPGERVFLDMLSMQPPVGVAALSKSNWRTLVYECTNFKISQFFHRKDKMAEATCKLLKLWKDKGIMSKFVWMDNAGENMPFKHSVKSKDWQLEIHMEYTLRDTPQHNHLVELAFAAIGTKVEQCFCVPMCL